MAVFQTEIMICATAYVQADTAEEAQQILSAFHYSGLEMPEGTIADGMEISGARLDSDELPEVSLSPAMTIYIQNINGAPIMPDDFQQADDGSDDEGEEA